MKCVDDRARQLLTKYEDDDDALHARGQNFWPHQYRYQFFTLKHRHNITMMKSFEKGEKRL
jgi:hypothetical protein